MDVKLRSLVAMVRVADVEASIEFYERLGFDLDGSFAQPGEDRLSWASLACGEARIMLARADEPVVAAQQAVMFYAYCADVGGMHEQLAASGVAVGPITKPFYNPDGEFRIEDPDGYVVMVTHL